MRLSTHDRNHDRRIPRLVEPAWDRRRSAPTPAPSATPAEDPVQETPDSRRLLRLLEPGLLHKSLLIGLRPDLSRLRLVILRLGLLIDLRLGRNLIDRRIHGITHRRRGLRLRWKTGRHRLRRLLLVIPGDLLLVDRLLLLRLLRDVGGGRRGRIYGLPLLLRYLLRIGLRRGRPSAGRNSLLRITRRDRPAGIGWSGSCAAHDLVRSRDGNDSWRTGDQLVELARDHVRYVDKLGSLRDFHAEILHA